MGGECDHEMWDSALRASLWKTHRYLSYAPPAYECGTRPFLGGSGRRAEAHTRLAVQKMPRTSSALPFLRRFRRQVINLTPPRRVKAWGTRPEVYPVQSHTRPNRSARHGQPDVTQIPERVTFVKNPSLTVEKMVVDIQKEQWLSNRSA